MAADFNSLPTPFGSFDLAFDETFQGLIPATEAPEGEECVPDGAYLTWLAPNGWTYHYFEGYYDTSVVVSSRGTFVQGGLSRHTQKESANQVVVRTANLPVQEADRVSTIFDSIAVFLFSPAESGGFASTPVTVDPGTYPVRSTSVAVHSITVSLQLPARRSARA